MFQSDDIGYLGVAEVEEQLAERAAEADQSFPPEATVDAQHATALYLYMQCTAFHFKNIRHSNALHCTELSESLLQRRTLKEAQALPALKGARGIKDG